jgi:AraC-like DNA-binding protein
MSGSPSRYVESPPLAGLDDLVACQWAQRIAPGSASYAQRVLPDGCVDIVWQPGRDLVVAGPATTAAIADLLPGTVTLGLRFVPGAAGTALGVPASELRDDTVELADVWGDEAAWLTERVATAPSPALALVALAAAITERRAAERAVEPDSLVAAAARELEQPGVRVRELGATLGVSERQLRRRFDDAVGYGPKTFDRVTRLQRFLRHAEHPGETHTLGYVAATAGYADQAHLTRDCRRLTSLTPKALLATRAAAA